MSSKKNNWQIIWGIVKRRINLRSLLVLVLLLSANTYAWFIYTTRVSGIVSAHVAAWNVLFEVGEEQTSQTVSFNIDDVYPGMTTYSKTLTVTNRGETSATLNYTINSANILGTSYVTSESLTSGQLNTMLANNYPFTISIGISNSSISPGTSSTFSLSVSWPYESGNDEEDTYWGDLAYTYRNTYPDASSISIDITISALQNAT